MRGWVRALALWQDRAARSRSSPSPPSAAGRLQRRVRASREGAAAAPGARCEVRGAAGGTGRPLVTAVLLLPVSAARCPSSWRLRRCQPLLASGSRARAVSAPLSPLRRSLLPLTVQPRSPGPRSRLSRLCLRCRELSLPQLLQRMPVLPCSPTGSYLTRLRSATSAGTSVAALLLLESSLNCSLTD